MKRHEEDPLLKELLGGEELSAFRRGSLERGLDAVRQARRQREAFRIGAMAAGPLLLAASLFLYQSRNRPAEPAAVIASRAPAAASPLAEPAPIRYIGDDELFALFPGRSMALIGAPGHQELVFLDHPAGTGSARGL